MARAFDCSRAPRGARARCAIHPVAAGFRPASAALAVAFAFGLAASPARAQSVFLQATHGTASVQRSGASMTVITGNGPNGNYSAIDWRSFSVPAGSITNFIQPSATSTSINRVVEANPTEILGQLKSNGRLVLVNPWGIAVGAGAQVDTAGFTASTLALGDEDAIGGRSRFAGSGSLLKVDGVIKAKGGDVVLIAPHVQAGAKAVIESDGAVLLAAGQKVEITGRGLEGIRMQVQAGNQAVNLGSLQGDAVGMFAGTLRHSGLAQAQAVSTAGGKVVLKATGDALVDGTVRASAGQRGGAIDVLGGRVGLLAGAALDASGAAGGGQVRIGGDAQGANAVVPNARRTYVDAKASVRADATQRGDGGRIIVWADEVTRMHGQLSARGGPQGGNGGFAEVSGLQSLAFTGRVDLRAPRGKAGTLLLDPNDIVITGSQATDTTTTGSVFEGGGDVAHVAAADLNAQLALGDVIVSTSGGSSSTATGKLTLASDAGVSWHSGTTLTLAADNGIALQGQLAATSSADGSANGALHLVTANGSIVQAAGSTLTAGQLLAQAPQGDVLLEQANHVGTVAGLSGDAGRFSFHNAQDLVVGAVSVGTGFGAGINAFDGKLGATSVSAQGGLQVRQSVAGGSVTLTAAGALDVQGPVSVEARSGKATLDAGSDLRVATETGTYTTTVSGSGGLELKAGGAVRASGLVFNAAGGLDIGVAQFSGGGGAGKGVTVTAAGDIDFGPVSSIDAAQSPVNVSSTGGSILGQVNVTSGGGVDGTIALGARGNVEFGTLVADGSAAAPQAAAVTVTAGGSVHGAAITSLGAAHGSAGNADGGTVSVTSTDGNITLGTVVASGGAAQDAGIAGVTAGSGGAITLSALGVSAGSGNVSVGGGLVADGGAGGFMSALPAVAGGAGGTVTVLASRDITLGQGEGVTSLSASGGAGGSATAGTAGSGAGGTVSLSSVGGSILSAGTVQVLANGGDGPDPANPLLRKGGGTIAIQALAGSITLDSLQALDSSSGTSPRAGDGGTITVTAGQDLTLTNTGFTVLADGGFTSGTSGGGGSVSLLSTGGNLTVAGDIRAIGGGGGQGGRGGQVSARAAGNLDVQGVAASSGASSGANSTAPLAGSVTLTADQGDLHARFVTVRGGAANQGVAGDGGALTLTALGTPAAGGRITVDNGLDADGGTGSFTVGGPDAQGGKGGTILVKAGRDLLVGTPAGGVTAPPGEVSARGGFGSGAAGVGGGGGQIQLGSAGGSITVSGGVAAVAGIGSLAGGQGGGRGGSVTLQALGTGPGAGNVTVAGVVDASGAAAFAGAAGDAGTATVHASGNVQLSSVHAAGGFAQGSAGRAGNGGLVDVNATSGSIELTGGIDAGGGFASQGAGAAGGAVTLRADKDITVAGSIGVDGGTAGIFGSSDTGGQGGTVDLSSANGNITTAGISASGGFSASLGAGGGGIIRLSALGKASTAGTITDTASFSAEGGGTSTGTGGRGGQVSLQADKDVHVAGVFAHGGDSGEGAAGGAGGNVSARFGGALATGFISAHGGTGGEGTTASPNGGAGGAGGTIDLGYTGSGTFVLDGATMLAMGGQGGGALPASAGLGGAGGQGGTITVAAPAGSVSLQLNADRESRSTLLATAGFGGLGGDGVSVGATGAAGQVNAQAGANLNIAAANLFGAASIVATAGGTLELGQDLATIGGSITLQAGGDLNVRAAIDTTQGGLAPAGALVKLQAGGNVLLDVPPPVVLAGGTSPAPTTTTNPATTTTTRTTTTTTSPALTATALAAGIGGGSVAGTSTTISGSSVTVGSSTSIVATGGDVVITADRLDLQGTIAAGSARTVLRPLTATRAMRLGGIDDGSTLHLSQAEVGRIAAGTLLVGDGANTGGLTVGGAITVDPALVASLSLVTRGAITQAAASPLAAQALNADGGSVNLDQVTVSTLSGRGQSGAFTVANQGGGKLSIGTVDGIAGVVASGPVQVTTPGALALDASLTSNASGNAITLDAASLAVGSGATLATPAGRWLVYLDGPDGNNFGTLASNNFALWGRSFSANPPSTLTEGGNRYLFALQPTLDVTANSASKIYNGSAGFGTLGFTATGFVDAAAHQNAFLQDGLAQLGGALAIANPGKDVGSYAITQGTLASPSGYAIHFTGNTATITPAPLTIAADNLGKTEGTALSFSGTEFTAQGLVAGEQVSAVTLASPGAPASAPAGAYPITASNAVGVNGFQAGNYDIRFLNGALAVAAAPSPPPPQPQPQTTAQSAPVQQVNNQVVTFASLFVEEARIQPALQASLEGGSKRLGQDDIVVTDNACKR